MRLAQNYGFRRCELRRIEQLVHEYREQLHHGWGNSVVTLILSRVTEVTVTEETLGAELEDVRTISAPLGWYPRLVHSTPRERANYQISGAGYGIHWPDLDEDLSVEGLFFGRPSTEGEASFARWLAARSDAAEG